MNAAKPENGLYFASHMRLFEQMAVDELGLTEEELMQRAGEDAFEVMQSEYPHIKHIAVYCGGGNNAGDGYVLAYLAYRQGYSVVVYRDKEPHALPEAACHAALRLEKTTIPCFSFEEPLDGDVELIVDALLGVGLKSNVREPLLHVIRQINEANLPVFSLDLPSGLNSDTGSVMGEAVVADVTVTFIADKLGLYTKEGRDRCGKIVVSPLGLESCRVRILPIASTLDADMFHSVLKKRPHYSHKGHYGHVLVIGGSPGMPGAPHLAAMASLRVGAGMATVVTHPDFKAFLPYPEVMVRPLADSLELDALLKKAAVVVIGPGLSDDPWAVSLFKQVLSAPVPLVVDAGALRLLAKNKEQDDNWVLTPHPGEAADLLACGVHEIEADRYHALHTLQQQYGGVVVLKGSGSLISDGKTGTFVCTRGNPGMATAGMGDVLSGMIAGLIAQGLSLIDAASCAVWLHAKAADELALALGERGLVATDLLEQIRFEVNRIGTTP